MSKSPQNDLFQILQSAPIWSEEKSLKRGQLLGQQGGRDDQVYWVLEGVLRIFTVLEDQDFGVRFAYQGELFSRLDTYISGEASRYHVQALRYSRYKSCSKQHFETFLDSEPKAWALWQKGLYQLVYDMLEREEDLMINDPQKRLQRVLKRSPRLFQEVPHKYIASYLRMSPETLSRLLNS